MDEDLIRVVKLNTENLLNELVVAEKALQNKQLDFLVAQQERDLLLAKYERYRGTMSVLEELYLSGVVM